MFQVKPRGGIFFDKFERNSSSVRVHYSLVADELALYRLTLEDEGAGILSENKSHLEVDVHRR